MQSVTVTGVCAPSDATLTALAAANSFPSEYSTGLISARWRGWLRFVSWFA
jgi:hypothetical protein